MALFSIRSRLAGARARPRSRASPRLGVAPQTKERFAEASQSADRPGIEALRLLEVLHRRIPASEALLGLRRSPDKGGIAGRDAQPLLVLLQGAAGSPRDQPFVVAERQVPLRAVRRERDGLLRRLPGALRERGRRRAVGVQERIGHRDSCPRLREAGIQRHGLLVEAERLAQARGIAGRQAVRRFLALQEGVVGGEVLRGLLGEPLLLARSERAAQRLRHLRRDVRLHLEHVRQRRVERLLPLRGRRIRTPSRPRARESRGRGSRRRSSPSAPSPSAGTATSSSSAICFGVLVVFL